MGLIEGIRSIPTLYDGVQYRSRLEARWAAFFDQLRWPFEYEPCDFAGWIPDFLLLGASRVFVEVKPADAFPLAIADEIKRSGCADECLILGMMPGVTEWGRARLGWLREMHPDGSGSFDEAPFSRWCGSESMEKNPAALLGFCHGSGWFLDRITGCYDGGSYGSADDAEVAALVQKAWRKAGNAVQWQKPT